MKQPPIKTKELYGSTVQIADGQNWEIASITAYGENAQGGTTEAPVALTGVDSVQVCGKNMLPNKAKTNTVAGITYTVNPDKSVTAKGTATSWSNIVIDADFSLPAGTYTLNSNIQTAGVSLVIGKDTSGKKNIAVSATASKTFTLSDSIKHYVAYIAVAPDSVVDTTIRPMLNLGKTAMPYEPYKGNVTQLPIPRPLRKVGDVRDVCRTRVKSVYDKRIVLDGTENWNISSSKPNSFLTPVSERIVNGLSDSYPTLKSPEIGTKNGIYLNYTADIIVTDLACSTVEEFKAHLSAHPLTVYYRSTAYDGTNGLDVCLTEYQTGYIESYADESITTAWISSTGALSTGAEVAYVLSSPETYATDPLDIDNAAGPLTVMTGGEVEVTLTHRMLTPYTAWTIQYDSEGEYTGDFFNVEDYDRIKQNIEYLREYAYFLYGGFTLRGMAAVTVESYGYASTIDALDANLEAIAANTFRPPDMLPVKQWRGNQPPPGADDWNRIENTCLLLFEQFERQSACLPKLAFELKGSAF